MKIIQLLFAILCMTVLGECGLCAPYPAAENAIRAFEKDPALELKYVETVTNPRILDSVGSFVANPYHEYTTPNRVNYRVDAIDNTVIWRSQPTKIYDMMLPTEPQYESIVSQFLNDYGLSQSLYQYQKIAPGWYYRKHTATVLDFYNTIEVIVNRDGIPMVFHRMKIATPSYSGTTNIAKNQALTIAQNYLTGLYTVPITYSLSTIYQNQLLIHQPDDLGVWQPVWKFFYEVQTVADNPEDQWDEGYNVYVNAVDGSVFDDRDQWLGGTGETKPKFGKQVGLRVMRDGLLVRTGQSTDVPIGWLMTLAKTHKLTAKAGEMAFTMDGKRIALPSKVVAKAGTVYLPWQALKSLPGVKCNYDAKLNRLDITTAPPTSKRPRR